jgi:hypothetical protein
MQVKETTIQANRIQKKQRSTTRVHQVKAQIPNKKI